MKKLLLLVFAIGLFSVVKADEGMWLLSRLKKENIAKMQQMGLKLSADDIYSANHSSLKDAIVGLANEGRPFSHFCSAEIISPEGLILTNHHCGFSTIQKNSTVEHNYLHDGFWAFKKTQELVAPTVTASILQKMVDVSDEVNARLNDNMSEAQRAQVISQISKRIVDKATAGTNYSGQVQSMFSGNQFFLFLYIIYKDVRLVAAPPMAMGKFGGDTDNWMWTRHTADFSMMRIYTAPDGSPAAYSPNNVPLKPKHFLPVSAKGINDGDFAMIMGFPGSTDRYSSSYGLKTTMDVTNDVRYKVRTIKLDVLKSHMNVDPKVKLQYAAKYAQCANYWKYSKVQNEALKNLNTMGDKLKIEKDFTEWLSQNPEKQKEYGNVLNMLKNAYAHDKDFSVASSYLNEAFAGPEAHIFALQSSKILETYCDKNLSADKKSQIKKYLKEKAKEFYKDFNTDVEADLIANLFPLYRDNVADAFQAKKLNAFVAKKCKGSFKKFAELAKKKSIFLSEDKFNAFLDKPSLKVLHKDVIMLAGTAFLDAYQTYQASSSKVKSEIARANRLFLRGRMEMSPNKAWAPDANSTIRLTYGKVKSYKPKDGVFYDYFTTLKGVMEKEGPKGGEFEVPDRLKELYLEHKYGNYGNDYLAVNFITDNDITGGNSGSGVINANGELIGTAFDGNSEAMSGDIDFEENMQRCINLDARYMLWIVDVYAGAKNLINEMTIVR